MKNIYTVLFTLLLIIGLSQYSFSQCPYGEHGSWAIGTPTGGQTATSDPAFCLSNIQFSSVTTVAGACYEVTSSVATDFITVFKDLPTWPGSVVTYIAWGGGPLIFCSDETGPYYVQTNFDATCLTGNGCRNISVRHIRSPGNVGESLDLWLKADAGLSPPGSNVNVTAWADQSVTPLTTTVNGTLIEESSVVDIKNYNAHILFNGAGFVNTDIIFPQSFFYAAQLTELNRSGTHLLTFNDHAALPDPSWTHAGGNNGSGVAEYSELGASYEDFQAPGVWRKNGDPTGVNYNTPHSGDFDIISALGTGVSGLNGGYVNSILGGETGVGGSDRDWIGKVGELAIYSGVLTPAYANKIESYLAIKFGLTLGGNGSTTLGYTSTVGTPIWSANSGYHNNVIGIGRDDNEALYQKQSHAPDDNYRVYLDALQTLNEDNTGTFSNDISYLLTGHDLGASCATPASELEMPATLYSRIEREWRVTNTNFSDNFSFDMELATPCAAGAVDITHLRLLVDDDGDFSDAAVYDASSGILFAHNAGRITVSGISTSKIPIDGSRYITIGSSSAATPLPIQLASFNATCLENKVKLSWSTASETNNDHFTIERSVDGEDFEAIATINGAGNSNELLNYSWIDDASLNAVTYYQLKQTDFDGNYSYSEMIVSECRTNSSINIYPNPAQNLLSIDHYSGINEDLIVEIYDMMGQLIMQKMYNDLPKGESRINMNIDELSDGIYFVTFTNSSNKTLTHKLSVVK